MDIVGSCELFVNLPVLGKIKQLIYLVLRGKDMDREILISCQMLKKWDMIHPTIPAQTRSTYVRNLTHVLDQNKISSIYEKSKISTKERITKGNKKCTKLRQHILKEYHDVFKDRLDKT